MNGIDRTAMFRLLSEALKSLHNTVTSEQELTVVQGLVADLEGVLKGVPPLHLAA